MSAIGVASGGRLGGIPMGSPAKSWTPMMARDCALVVRREVQREVSAADLAGRPARSQLYRGSGWALSAVSDRWQRVDEWRRYPAEPSCRSRRRGIRPRYTGGIRELYQQLKRFQVRPAADRHSVCLADRPVRAGHDRQGQREQRAIAPLPDRQPGGVRLLRPHDGGGCAQSLGMKDAFVPSSVLRLRRRLSEDKMINIDIADVLFAGMVFPVMKFVKKIVLPRVRKAWEKVKEVAKKMACTEAPPVSDLESQSESNGSTDDLDHA